MELDAISVRLSGLFRARPEVTLVYLFGSTVRGDTHPRSDIDLAVLFGESSLRAYRELWSAIRDALGAVSFDLVSLNEADPVLCHEVIREGQPLFYRSVEELNAFENRSWHRYQDTRRLRAIGDLYLNARVEAWSSKRSPSASASSDSMK